GVALAPASDLRDLAARRQATPQAHRHSGESRAAGPRAWRESATAAMPAAAAAPALEPAARRFPTARLAAAHASGKSAYGRNRCNAPAPPRQAQVRDRQNATLAQALR